MVDNRGRIQKGERLSPNTEFKKGQHWRPYQRFRDKDYLELEYVVKHRSAAEIADDWDVTENAIYFWLHKHSIPRRSMSQIRKIKKWKLTGKRNGMYGRRGKDNPNWMGGCTPERQDFYQSQEWKDAVRQVWKECDGICQSCAAESDGEIRFNIHHIVSFAVKSLRSEPRNLVLLCEDCHNWVHSKENKHKLFIREVGNYRTGNK